VQIGGLTLTLVPVKHGILDILGWMIQEGGSGNHAVYITDTSAIPPESLDLIRGAALLVIGGLREQPHETHFSFEQALNTGAEIRAPRVYLTHICHSHSHREIKAFCYRFQEERRLRKTVMEPAYDGMELELKKSK
jgi:phosphoribosyl 1,2-cyclic phosphate phosphodiesterase